MANYPLCFCIFRIVLPCILAMCAILRPCGLSAIYLMFLFYLPFVQVPKATTILGRTGLYLKIMIGVSTITTLVQSAFITFAFITDPGAMMASCSTLERVLRHVGFVYLNGASQLTISTWVFPEYLMLVTSVTIYVSCKKLAISRHPEDGETATLVPKKKTSNNYFTLFASIGRYNVLVALCLSAVMRPSLLGGVYFLVFLSCATWWACYKQLKQGFAILMRFVAGLALIHLCLWYVYQMQWPQELADAESPVIRLLGLKPILQMTCDAPTKIIWTQQEWATYCAPLALYLLYYSIIVASKLLLKPQVVVHEKRKSKVYSEQTPLIRGASPSRTYSSRRLTNEGMRHISTEEIPMDQLEEEYKPTLIENIMYVSEAILQVIIQSSYIGTNIIMMAWSITYLSWVTFVLLIWANLLWLIPNQRKAMLRSSPFLVIYAWFLLISAYVYCLDLTEKELPSSLDNVNLSQIGFVKILVLPCNSLMIKCLYTGMFWITLRQYMQERIAERQSSALADMVAPLQVTVTTATGAEEVQKQSTKVMDKIGKYFRTFISTIWIWLVAVTLFGVAITGDKMTGFRIIYMALFVVFIISFQLSFRVWRRIMFGFWLTVIIYSMAMLVMVYTYQFDYFPYYWSEYLGVALEQQADIGLETYETKQLFVRLVTPTFFVIITVVQLHYFHKDFMALYEPISNEKKLNEIKVEREGDDPQSEEAEVPSLKFELSELGNLSAIETKQLFQNILQKSIYYWNLMFLFLEIHMSKLVLLVGALEAVMDPFALDMIVVILIVLGFSLGKKVRTIAIYTTSVLLSLSLLGRMIYQIKYFHPEEWNVNCTRHNLNETIITTNNDASWIGFSKLTEGDTLMDVVRWDVIFIVITTVWRIIKIRQAYHRAQFNIPQNTTGLMYPRITRADADRDLITYLRYLLNYGYYKFGLEICLMATVAVIGIRMDMYALFYALWLCVLHSMSRKNVAKIWNVYLIFIGVLLPVQYMMAIGLPPTLCIELPWDTNATLKRFQEWAFLLDSTKTLPAQKLICDFVLFFLVCRQARVFKIERGEIGGLPYPGGSNKVIIHYSEDELFVNPVPDFITYCRSYLDVFKRSILLSMLWVTLAVIFLAGTNRVNLFSIGYLIGAFSFLWLGTDLYLWPIPKILKSWRWLLAYNVFVITVKVALQIVGCIFIKDISSGICWPIQLFGIGCVNKFEDTQFMKYTNEKSNCYVPREFMGLVWDGLSFACLIIQRRIFHSYNFFHMIDETKASAILASRGAELIEELRNKRMIEQEEHEHRVLEKIKAKMDRIKANQQRVQGDAFREVTTHHMDGTSHTKSSGRANIGGRSPKTHPAAVRSGDYYMFDDLHIDDLEELDDFKFKKSRITAEEEEEEQLETKMTVSELFSMTMKSDIPSAVRGTTGKDRRCSFPEAKQRSDISARSQESHTSAPPRVDEQVAKTVTIVEVPQPEPSTSRQDEVSEQEPPAEEHQTLKQKILFYILFLWACIESTMLSLTKFLNKYSRDYRYVTRELRKEKMLLKETTNYSVGVRMGSSQVWRPAGSYHDLMKSAKEESTEPTPPAATYSPSDSYRNTLISERTTSLPQMEFRDKEEKPPSSSESDTKAIASLPHSSELGGSKSVISLFKILEEDEEEMSSYDQPIILRLLLSFWYVASSRSEVLCYFIIFLNQMKSATFLSLPLPLMVFLWGTLTLPRPSKTFWVTIIAYTEVIVLIKCMFQFEIIPWNKKSEIMIDPLYPPRIIGIERKPNYAVWDLLLLLVVFFHRFMLKSMGLWRTSVPPDPRTYPGLYKMDEDGKLTPLKEPKGRKKSQISYSGGAQEILTPYNPSEDTVSNKTTSSTYSTSSNKSKHIDPVKDPGQDQEGVLIVTNDRVDPGDHFRASLKMAAIKYTESFKDFLGQMVDPTSRVAADVYSYMFLCDFFNFFVLLLGYTSFGAYQGDGGVTSYLEDNKIPVLFLLMLIMQFMLIIIDRGIYLRKNMLAKIIFQFSQIVLLHIWLFILYPTITERSFNSVIPPQMFYMVKCFYLLLSAYQIRCGYPTRILGNFICKGYNYVNMFLFKAFLALPFLFELRTVMDWMWTDTSMTVFDWMKMEDIFAHIFQIKCTRYVEAEYPQERGVKKKVLVKYIMGGGVLMLIIGIIWFPLVFFSLGNAVGMPNIPYDVTLELRIGPYEPIYHMSAQSNSIYQFSSGDLNTFQEAYSSNKMGFTFISNYEAADIAAVVLSVDSSNVWSISPPDRQRMEEEIESDKPLSVRLDYKVSHKTSKSEDSGIISNSVQILIPASSDNITNPQRTSLLAMLRGNDTVEPVVVGLIMPKFLKVTNKGVAKPVTQLMNNIVPGDQADSLRGIRIKLNTKSDGMGWWEIHENCSDANYIDYLNQIPYKDCGSIILYTFNDKIFPATLNMITGGGIVGLYTTLVLVAAHFLRGFFAGQCFKIMFEDMPCIDRVLQLCLDIYLVRESGEFNLEEDLFAKLIFLFRSPETLIKWTRPIEEANDEEEDE